MTIVLICLCEIIFTHRSNALLYENYHLYIYIYLFIVEIKHRGTKGNTVR